MKTGIVPKPYLKQEQDKITPSLKVKGELDRQKAVDKAQDTLELMGHEDRIIGTKAVIEEVDRWSKSELNIIDKRLMYLESRRNRKQSYFETLAGFVWYGLKELDWPAGWHWEIELTEKGIKVCFNNRFNKKYQRGFKPSGKAKYDEAACRTLVGSCEDTIYRLMYDEEFRKGKGGIYLPN